MSRNDGKKYGFARSAASVVLTASFIGASFFGARFVVDAMHPQPQPPDPHASTSEVLYAFNEASKREPWSANEFRGRYTQMEDRQKDALSDPEEAGMFEHYLAGFDKLKGRSLEDQAQEVNRLVNARVAYTEDPQSCSDDGCGKDYWKSAYETFSSRQGDCEDYAILKHDILRYLGVPENRMYLATVDSQGKGIDHAVLLLNTAQNPDKESRFIILDINGVNGPLVDSRDSKYLLYSAMNDTGYWEPPVQPKIPDENGTSRVAAGKITITLPRFAA